MHVTENDLELTYLLRVDLYNQPDYSYNELLGFGIKLEKYLDGAGLFYDSSYDCYDIKCRTLAEVNVVKRKVLEL